MHRRYGLLIPITAIIVLSSAYFGFMGFNASGLPLAVQVVGARTGVIVPVRGVPLPKGVHAGERLDLAAQPRSTRMAIAQLNSNGQQILPGKVYGFAIGRGPTAAAVSVTSVRLQAAPSQGEQGWLELFEALFSGAIALVAVWRGRDRAAAGLALFATAFLAGRAMTAIPCEGAAGLAALLGAWALFMLARAGFYVMAESMAGAALSRRERFGWRGGFLLLLGAGAMIATGGPLIYVITGWAELLRSPYGLVATASYLVPVALLFVSYHRTEVAQRLRLRWMLWSGGIFGVGIALTNTRITGARFSSSAPEILQAFALAGFLYAILRHRLVDVRVVFSRTLVYAMTTSLVLGLFALLESLIERAALGHGTSLALELAVPLGLGVSLSTVHRRIDETVDRLIFRRQYREEVALRRFASESACVTQPESLLDLTVDQLQLHVGAPWVALYEYTPEDYARVRQRGAQDLPQSVAIDDLALVRLRAHESEVDLHAAPSGLGRDGFAFPLRARGHLLGVLVVGPRPGEHYAAEERELMAHVAHAVGASLFALRAQVTEEQLISARAEIEAGRARLSQACAQVEAGKAVLDEARRRESTLLEALRALGAASRV
jgi:hypothetical protein